MLKRDPSGKVKCTEAELRLLAEVLGKSIKEAQMPINSAQTQVQKKIYIQVLGATTGGDAGLTFHEFYAPTGPVMKAERLNSNRPKGGFLSGR